VADESLIALAAAVADGAPIDWASATQSLETADDLSLLDGLRLIAEVTGERGLALPPPPDAAFRDSGAPGLKISDNAISDNAISDHGIPGGGTQLEQWGPLRIVEQVGRGTFGDVYRAWDTRLDREVALKILRRPESGSDSTTVIEEGRLLARIRHPNVVTVYGAERVNGRVGVWMEFVHGPTLEDELRERGPFEADRVVLIAVELGGALAAVHRAGLLHRDVKTHNVMRDRDGRLLLTDFGSGELLESELAATAVGTPLFAAPEVVAGQPATRQSDIYSLGVLLYRLATGGYPVEGRTLEEVRQAHAQGRRGSLHLACPGLPDAVVTAIERALAPSPARRYASADDLSAAFSTLAEQSGILPAPRTVYVSAPRRRGRVGAIVAASVLLACAGATVALWPKAHPPSIAVLPLKNLGSDPNSGDVADGLTDEIIRQLTTIRGLEVRSRTSSFAFKDEPRDLRVTGNQLHSDFLLVGSVLRSDGRIRINARLVRVSDDATIWAEKYDRDIKDILAIQDDISRSIVGGLRLKLDANPRHADIDVATYERYLRARSLSDRKDPASLRTAIAFYREVNAKEPRFAPAYAGLADAYADYEFWGVNYEDTYSQIKEAASKALELDPLLPEAHAAMGLVHARDRDWAKAEAAFRRSIEINTNLSRTRAAYAFWALYQQGKLAQALDELQRALTLDPLSLDLRRMIAYVQLSAGEYAAAIDNCLYVLKADPKFPLVPLVLARARLFTGNSAEAIRRLEEMPPNRAPELGYALATVGRRTEAEALAVAAAGVPSTEAVIFAGLKDKDRTFAALERAAAIGDPKIGGELTYPELAFLRDDPRFAAFARRIGVAPQ
jgi:serine/threonine protein kinase/tetratricopeptide (TPR) repeat protein